jgi:hypothetical protein
MGNKPKPMLNHVPAQAQHKIEQLIRQVSSGAMPRCGWLQSDMVEEIRRRSAWMNTAAIMLGLLAAAANRGSCFRCI